MRTGAWAHVAGRAEDPGARDGRGGEQNFLAASGSTESWASLWSAGNSQFGVVAAATPAHQVAADTFCGSNPSVSQNDLMARPNSAPSPPKKPPCRTCLPLYCFQNMLEV